MGTYTTNYNLFMPSVGEQGWGELVNGNFATIDTTMKGLNTRIGTLETETDAIASTVNGFGSRITAIENEVNGALSCTSVTTSGTITSTGKITANGGITATTAKIDDISSMNLSTTSGVIGGMYWTFTNTVAYVSGQTSSTITLTYKSNPINNKLTFIYESCAYNSGTNRGTITINGTLIKSYSASAWNNGGIAEVGRYTATLKHNDVIALYVEGNKTDKRNISQFKITNAGYLVSS